LTSRLFRVPAAPMDKDCFSIPESMSF